MRLQKPEQGQVMALCEKPAVNDVLNPPGFISFRRKIQDVELRRWETPLTMIWH